jgi:hypothetical protein
MKEKSDSTLVGDAVGEVEATRKEADVVVAGLRCAVDVMDAFREVVDSVVRGRWLVTIVVDIMIRDRVEM